MTSKCRTEDMAERVKSVRFTLGLSQVALADRLQVAFSTVNRWERGKTRPLPALLRQLKALEMEATASKKGKKRSGGKGDETYFRDLPTRKDVLTGDLKEEMFAAHLRDVIDAKADPIYRDPAVFFRGTRTQPRASSHSSRER